MWTSSAKTRKVGRIQELELVQEVLVAFVAEDLGLSSHAPRQTAKIPSQFEMA